MKILVVTAAAVTLAGGIGLASIATEAVGASKPAEYQSTFQMFANVDANGDLGSNHDAAKVSVDANHIYTVRFTRSILHCALVAQAGRAGGADPVKVASSRVANPTDGTKSTKVVIVDFTNRDGTEIAEPFMLTATC